ncbi:hypothetical protein [Paenibacillus sp. FSL M7-0896]|uniref:hypothetical protein n=1 Tax=Paenibacillus sp. FSL M7-0896 TaxID=2921610 RepID=UPI0030DA909B
MIKLYDQFQITWTTDIMKLSSTDFPTFSDLYALIHGKEKKLGDKVYKEFVLTAA